MATIGNLVEDFGRMNMRGGESRRKNKIRKDNRRSYDCSHCKKSWSSANSEILQTCNRCLHTVSPQHQADSNNPKPRFGFYRCTKCKKEWRSANSWEGYDQKCNTCFKKVLPYRLEIPKKLEDGENKKIPVDNKKRHPQELCAKCRELGHSCVDKDRENESEFN